MTKRLKKLLFGKTNKLSENIILCLAITLAAAFTYYDHYNGFMEGMRIFLAFFIFVIWMIGSFSAGKSKQWGFLIFTGIYWIMPRLYLLYYPTRDNLRNYSKWLSMLNKISDIIVNKPFTYIAEKTGEAELLFTVVLMVIVVSMYFIGVNLRSLLKKKPKPEEVGIL